MNLDNRRVAQKFLPVYYLRMAKVAFRDRVLAAGRIGDEQGRAIQAVRRPYHAIDKFLKREGATTSAENANALAKALVLTVDGEAEYEELRQLFYQLDEQQRQFLIASIRGPLR